MSLVRRAMEAPTTRPPTYPHVTAETARMVGGTAKAKNRGGGLKEINSGAVKTIPGKATNSNASSQPIPKRIALLAMTAAANHQKAVREKWRCVSHAIQGDNTMIEMRKIRNTGCGFYHTVAAIREG